MSNDREDLYDRMFRREIFEPFYLSIPHSFDVDREKLKKIRMKDLPKKYIINENACILFWDEDGEEKTVVKRTPKDKFNKRLAFLTAYFQKHSGLSKTQANKYLDNLVVQEQKKK